MANVDTDKRLEIARSFGAPRPLISVWQILSTALALTALWLAMHLTLDVGYWLTLLLAIPAAGLVVRLFMIQHDCGHGAFFRRRWINDLVGRAISVITLTPYDQWRTAHAVHHAGSGNLDRRGVGDIDMLTVEEYLSAPGLKRFAYRLYRSPFILFFIGPVFHFVLRQRLPFGGSEDARAKRSIIATNVAIALAVAAGMYVFGPLHFLQVQVPITILASMIGVWLFFVQHQFDAAYWRPSAGWSFADAALKGSSHYELPRVLSWFSADIGLHHIHHLCSKIPNYRLRECLNEHPDLRADTKLGFWRSLRVARLALWDERDARLIGFGDLRKRTV